VAAAARQRRILNPLAKHFIPPQCARMKCSVLLALLVFSAPPLFAQTDEGDLPPPRAREMSVPLFNEKDFSGFTFCMKDHADPLKTWTVTNGVIHCTGTPTGYLRTTHSYSNYFLTVEWRFVKIAPKADNTGILVHIQPGDKVWPQCVQVQGKHEHQGDLFLMAGAESLEHKGKDANTPIPLRGDSVEHPVGEWNKAETICIHGKIESFINGKFVNETTGCTLDGGGIGIQSEGAEIEIRSMVYTPLKY
jgi:hypothetical protein